MDRKQEAKDVYQEAIIAFYERLQQVDFVLTCKIKTYLYAVCKHIWLKRLAEKKKTPAIVDEAETFAAVEEEMVYLEEKEKQFEMMKNALTTLGNHAAQLFRIFISMILPWIRFVTSLDIPNADNAKNQKYKCLQRLKKIFFAGL